MINQFESLLANLSSVISIVVGLLSIVQFFKSKKINFFMLCISLFFVVVFAKELIILSLQYWSCAFVIILVISSIAFLKMKDDYSPNEPFSVYTKLYLILIFIYILIQLISPLILNLLIDDFNVEKDMFIASLSIEKSLANIYSYLFSVEGFPITLIAITNLINTCIAVKLICTTYNNQKYDYPYTNTGVHLIFIILSIIFSCGLNYYLGNVIVQKFSSLLF